MIDCVREGGRISWLKWRDLDIRLGSSPSDRRPLVMNEDGRSDGLGRDGGTNRGGRRRAVDNKATMPKASRYKE